MDELTSETAPEPHNLETHMQETRTRGLPQLEQTLTTKILRERICFRIPAWGISQRPLSHAKPLHQHHHPLASPYSDSTAPLPNSDNISPPPTSDNTAPPSTSNREAGYMPVGNRQLTVDAMLFPRLVECLIWVILPKPENTQRSSLERRVGMVERQAPPWYEE
ncbi:hypothetical protein BDY19DRAFT_451995 [Irpex rosettiformis]|uniref:Uncharacterized protein n=2 Tax=Irpex rosettiformis TaxID=378272 RepID=A0ACB8TMJ3_9APHY|nr:hypothetical protein BDY19DRAFT_746964 [Irpex rosettiformis]KAI0085343.1 hypothetical protein BDY19DRAFT_451995 [Irpex rosettiformis]